MIEVGIAETPAATIATIVVAVQPVARISAGTTIPAGAAMTDVVTIGAATTLVAMIAAGTRTAKSG